MINVQKLNTRDHTRQVEHTLSVPSSLPETKYWGPRRATQQEFTKLLCPLKRRIRAAVLMSQSARVLSVELDTRCLKEAGLEINSIVYQD